MAHKRGAGRTPAMVAKDIEDNRTAVKKQNSSQRAEYKSQSSPRVQALESGQVVAAAKKTAALPATKPVLDASHPNGPSQFKTPVSNDENDQGIGSKPKGQRK